MIEQSKHPIEPERGLDTFAQKDCWWSDRDGGECFYQQNWPDPFS